MCPPPRAKTRFLLGVCWAPVFPAPAEQRFTIPLALKRNCPNSKALPWGCCRGRWNILSYLSTSHPKGTDAPVAQWKAAKWGRARKL